MKVVACDDKRHRRETVTAVSAEITPNNRHYLRGLDCKYRKFAKIQRDILNGKLRIVQNKKRTETDLEHDDDDDKEEKIPQETGKVYDTSERDGKYEPIRTDPENDSLEIHTDGETLQGKNSKLNIKRSNRNKNKPN